MANKKCVTGKTLVLHLVRACVRVSLTHALTKGTDKITLFLARCRRCRHTEVTRQLLPTAGHHPATAVATVPGGQGVPLPLQHHWSAAVSRLSVSSARPLRQYTVPLDATTQGYHYRREGQSLNPGSRVITP